MHTPGGPEEHTLHIAVCTFPEDDDFGQVHTGLIYDPENIFWVADPLFLMLLSHHFKPKRPYRLVVLETQKRAGELVRDLHTRYGAAVQSSTVEHLAKFTIACNKFEEMFGDILNHPELFYTQNEELASA